MPIAQEISSPCTPLPTDVNTAGTSVPASNSGFRSVMRAFLGQMLLTLIRFRLPMPAASRALSKAFRGVSPSATPVVIHRLSGTLHIPLVLPFGPPLVLRREGPLAPQ